MNRFSDEKRIEILGMRAQGKTYREIAAAIGTTKVTVWSLISRAKKAANENPPMTNEQIVKTIAWDEKSGLVHSSEERCRERFAANPGISRCEFILWTGVACQRPEIEKGKKYCLPHLRIVAGMKKNEEADKRNDVLAEVERAEQRAMEFKIAEENERHERILKEQERRRMMSRPRCPSCQKIDGHYSNCITNYIDRMR